MPLGTMPVASTVSVGWSALQVLLKPTGLMPSFRAQGRLSLVPNGEMLRFAQHARMKPVRWRT
jgi:hypothetical protein